MTAYIGKDHDFLCYSDRGSYYAVRDGAGLRYAHVEADSESGLGAAIADYLYFEAMDDADLMLQAAEERRWWGRPGLASAELDRRGEVA